MPARNKTACLVDDSPPNWKPGDLIKFSDFHVCEVDDDGGLSPILRQYKLTPPPFLRKYMPEKTDMDKTEKTDKDSDDGDAQRVEKYDKPGNRFEPMGGETTQVTGDKDLPSITITR